MPVSDSRNPTVRLNNRNARFAHAATWIAKRVEDDQRSASVAYNNVGGSVKGSDARRPPPRAR